MPWIFILQRIRNAQNISILSFSFRNWCKFEFFVHIKLCQMNPFLLFFIISDKTQDLIWLWLWVNIHCHFFTIFFNPLRGLSSHLIHENFVDDVLMKKNILIPYFFWTSAKTLVIDVTIPFPNRLIWNTEVKITA